jgi:hypothetical protein
MTALVEVARNFLNTLVEVDGTTKLFFFYENYNRFFSQNEFTPLSILEIGVYKGVSTKIFSRSFPAAKIVAVDKVLLDIDFSQFQNVTYLQADQADPGEFHAIINAHFPDGIDLVIEDASHIGALSCVTFQAVFPFVNKNGIYIVEDWGTGYWDTWVDGGRFQEYPMNFHDNNIPKRFPSHDFGMVGFVKSLVDMTHESAIKSNQNDKSEHSSRIKRLEFGEGFCFALKA